MPIIVAMEATIHPLRRVLHVQPGANLLDVPRKHQVPVSYSRLAGRCGTCRYAHLCGSPPMVEAATLLARRKGIAAGRIHADATT